MMHTFSLSFLWSLIILTSTISVIMLFVANHPVKKQKRVKRDTSYKESAQFTDSALKRCQDGRVRNGYCILSNVILANKRFIRYNDTVTLTTQSTVEFLEHVPEVCNRWRGPVSVAVYTPGSDFEMALKLVKTMRHSLNPCVALWVTWHFLYDIVHWPNITVRSFKEVPVVRDFNFSKGHASYYRRNQLPYPINVARNVARLTACTHYVLASDVELYPSIDIIPRFLHLMKTRNKRHDEKKEVFVLPVFEVEESVKHPPMLKHILRRMYFKNQATSFHQHTCSPCHRIPNLAGWITLKQSMDSFGIYNTTKRDTASALGMWEPFFISRNDFPYFDEALYWNGRLNKMQVALEMCLASYDFHILDNAFLVHAPGIKQLKQADLMKGLQFKSKNKIRMKQLKIELKRVYGTNNSCF